MTSSSSMVEESFRDKVRALSGQDAALCYLCWRCTTGCPLVEAMDLMPTQVVHCVRIGERETVLHSRTIWVCAACETCSTRCPQGIQVADLMDALRTLAIENGVAAAVPELAHLYRSIAGSVRGLGRLYELGMLARLKLSDRNISKNDIRLGLRMLAKRKLSLLPSPGGLKVAKRIARVSSELVAGRKS